MNKNVPAKTVEQMQEAILALDLDSVKARLMDPERGEGWDAEEANYHEREYKRFLALLAKYPDTNIIPDREIDAFWHAHILDTMKYARDCEEVFGYFLHHRPDPVPQTEEEAAHLSDTFMQTQSLYQAEFGNSQATDRYDPEYTAIHKKLNLIAYCAAVAEKRAAYCAAVPEKRAAYCAAVPEKRAAYCAAVPEKNAAYCAAVPEKNAVRRAVHPQNQPVTT